MEAPRVPPVSFDDIGLENVGVGKVRGDGDQIGWQSTDKATVSVWKIACIKQAEWFEGSIKMLVEPDDGSESEVVSMSGFKPADYDKLWRHVHPKGVFIKKREKKGSTNSAEFDAVLLNIEIASDEVDKAEAGSVQKKAREGDLMNKIEQVRDGLDQVIRGDKQALSSVFAENGCERIGRLRLVIDTVQVEMFKTDQRWKHIRNQARSIEGVLKSLGTFRVWQPEQMNESQAKRQVVLDLRRAQGLADTDEEDEPPPPRPVRDPQTLIPAGVAIDPRTLLPPGANPLEQGREKAAEAERVAVERRAAEETAAREAAETQRREAEATAARELAAAEAARKQRDEEALAAKEKEAESSRDASGSTPSARPRADTLGATPAPNASENIIEGWVWKQSRHMKKWRRRWLVLTPTFIATFETNDPTTKPTENIETAKVTDVRDADADTKQSGSIAVVAEGRTYLLIPDDKTKKHDWITKIKSTQRA